MVFSILFSTGTTYVVTRRVTVGIIENPWHLELLAARLGLLVISLILHI